MPASSECLQQQQLAELAALITSWSEINGYSTQFVIRGLALATINLPTKFELYLHPL